ncbi:MAG TPA: AmmeMemoRadiSam system radical SAM enzyme [Paludibacter sp.]|nr:AmmeMemoRadiSam system radical SAM enzyme [Paludibacter sp.]
MNTHNTVEFSRLASFQEVLSNKVIRCHICPHNCLIHENKTGLCHTRINIGGELYTTAYGNPCSVSMDPIEKKPLFHFFPASKIYSLATAGCNFRCLNCQNWQISQTSPQEIDHADLMPEELVHQALRHGSDMIAFTYTEPTVFYEYMFDTAKAARAKGIKTVLISNGFINPAPLLQLCPYLSAANIDLKCFSDEVYRRLAGGRLQPVLDTLKTLRENGVWLEITNLVIPGYSDSPEMMKDMCEWLVGNGFASTPLHFSRFFPTFNLPDVPPTDKNVLIKAKEIAQNSGMKYVYIGNLPGLHEENTYCPSCKKMLVERVGFAVTENNIRNGKCSFCGETIEGVWE